MKTAISIGARIITVDVEHTDAGYAASCTHRISGEDQRFVGEAGTYDSALQMLRLKILSAR